VTIRIYANDSMGNENFDEVTVRKVLSTPANGNIPGYDLFLLTGIIVFISIGYVKIRHKKLKN